MTRVYRTDNGTNRYHLFRDCEGIDSGERHEWTEAQAKAFGYVCCEACEARVSRHDTWTLKR